MATCIISDMDGVIYRGARLIPGANEFVARVKAAGMPFLFLTNASEFTPEDLRAKLEQRGISGLEPGNFITSAQVTAMFVQRQRPGARVFVVGERGLRLALAEAGCELANAEGSWECAGPVDYVALGKTRAFDFAWMKAASRLVAAGARFVGANPDLSDPMDDGDEPACGALLASIAAATGRAPYVVGKPNALMMTLATRRLGVHPDDAAMIGDRMDTDIRGGLEAGMSTALVLTGATSRDDLEAWPFRPDHVFESVADIDPRAL